MCVIVVACCVVLAFCFVCHMMIEIVHFHLQL